MKILVKKKLNIKTSKGIFSIVLESWEEDRGYTVRVSQLPEVVTEGSSISEAKNMAREAIELCLDNQENEHRTYFKSKRSSSIASPARV